ncbi:hypothetical protein FACS189476_04490 [Spirochaetia bacterium]|nr:hypothetical protein FACS189476_04490 [Spirochaetia bacterium]
MDNPFESAVAAGLGSCLPGTVFLAAVSGGADSTAMLISLARLRETRNFTLRCIHIEHGIRPMEESRGDAEAVRSLCRELDVPCKVVSIPPGLIAETAKCSGLGIEAAARQYRHRAWQHEARRIKAAAVLVAHTRDDALETTLMRVLRGSGPAGLAALPLVRGLIRRPLLRLSRADVLRYLEERGIPYRIDSTNQDNQYLRNRVRNRLIPLLDELFPHWKKGVAAMAETQSLAAAFLAGEARQRVVWEPLPEQPAALKTKAETFFAQSGIIREEALFQGIDAFKVLLKETGCGDIENADDGLAGNVPVKRSSLRLFAAAGEAPQSVPLALQSIHPALDLGFCRIGVKGPNIVIEPGKNEVWEAGFSLLIKEQGIYKLKNDIVSGFSLEVCPFKVRESVALSAGKERANGFYTALPLVLRPAFNDDFIILKTGQRLSLADVRGRTEFKNGTLISAAVDCRGVAAFIGTGPDGMIQVLRRDSGDSGDPSFFVALSHNHTGGIDA